MTVQAASQLDNQSSSPPTSQIINSSQCTTVSSNAASPSPSTTPSTQPTPTSGLSSPPAGQVSFKWGEVDGTTFHNDITASYEIVIHWKPNLFIPPHGNTGNSFVHELARLFQAFADGSSLGSIAMKAVTVQQQLLLQKPSKSSKSKEHIRHLQRRLDLWQKGDIDALLREGQCIQSRLKSKSSN